MEKLENQHDSLTNIGCALSIALDKSIPNQFKPVQQGGNHVLETVKYVKLFKSSFTYMVVSLRLL